jgi:hypothetical protein
MFVIRKASSFMKMAYQDQGVLHYRGNGMPHSEHRSNALYADMEGLLQKIRRAGEEVCSIVPAVASPAETKII